MVREIYEAASPQNATEWKLRRKKAQERCVKTGERSPFVEKLLKLLEIWETPSYKMLKFEGKM